MTALLLVLLLVPTPPVAYTAESIYETPEAFIYRQFDGQPPRPSMLYPKAGTKQAIKNVLGHKYSKFRIRYWLKDSKSVWILEEIGRDRPITTGFSVESSQLSEVKVLIFRESRGWEVKYDSFSNQFIDAKLTDNLHLDRKIDNITGATLSVRAVTNLARLALVLHKVVVK